MSESAAENPGDTDQAVPFQCRARPSKLDLFTCVRPTAHASVALLALAARSKAVLPGVAGTLAADQAVPFQARDIRRETGDRWGENVNSMINLGCTYLELSQFDLGLDCFQRVLAAAREAGNQYVQSLVLVNLAETYTRLARPQDVLACARQAVELTREIGYRQAEGTALGSVATAYRAMGQPGRARDWYQQALVVRRQIGDRHGEAEILRDLGDLSAEAGHARPASRLWRQALAVLDGLGDARACAEIRGRLDPPA